MEIKEPAVGDRIELEIRWITAVYGVPEHQGANSHIGVPETGRAQLSEMGRDILENGGHVGLYVPEGTEDNYSPGITRGRLVAIVGLVPMPAGRKMEDYFFDDLDGSRRWPIGWPCLLVCVPPEAECPTLREHVESLFGAGTFGGYVKRFQNGPFRLEPKMKERLNRDFARLNLI